MTDKKTEALKLALEALEYASTGNRRTEVIGPAITALREALAKQPAQIAGFDVVIDASIPPDTFRLQQPAQQDSTCNKKLREQGKAYPRTCKKCGLGPCIADRVQPAPVAKPHEQQEPVVWMYVNKSTHETKFQKHMSDFVDHSLWSEAPLYGEPLANHELHCVCGAVWCGDEMVHLPDKRPPASKPWVGLTDEEVIIMSRYDLEYAALIGEVQRKLKEKNT